MGPPLHWRKADSKVLSERDPSFSLITNILLLEKKNVSTHFSDIAIFDGFFVDTVMR
jgi:hypothetical protein